MAHHVVDVEAVLRELRKYQLTSDFVELISIRLDAGDLIFHVRVPSRKWFGSNEVLWRCAVPLVESGSSEEYGFDTWEALIAEDISSDYIAGIGGEEFVVERRDEEGRVWVANPDR